MLPAQHSGGRRCYNTKHRQYLSQGRQADLDPNALGFGLILQPGDPMGPVQVVGQDRHRHGITEEEKAKGAQSVQQRMCSRHRNNQEKQQGEIIQDGNQLVPPDPLAKAGNGAQKPLKLAAPLQVQDQIVHISVPIGFINLGAFQNDLRQPAVHQLHTRQTAGSHHIDQHAHGVNIRFWSGLVKAELLRCGKALGAQDLRIAALIALDGAANAKVDNLHRAVRRQHNIVWVNIPVNNTQLVYLLQPITDLERYILGFQIA